MTGTLVYDGDCAFCSRSAALARRLPARPVTVAYQVADLPTLGLTEQECRDAVQWVPGDSQPGDSQPAAGAGAVAALLLASGGPWSLAGRLMLVPGVRHLAAVVYRLVSENRYRLPGGTPDCAAKPPGPAG